MDANDLRIFEAVARLGGMNRAAEELHTVQSNVTTRIRNLEAELGVALFDRHARGVSPTAAGHRLLPYAAQVRDLLRDASQAARDKGEPGGKLVLGSLETTAALRLAPYLARYARQYPDVDLTLRTGTTRELIDDTLHRRIDGAFVCGPVDHPDLVAEPFCREELVALTAPGTHLNEVVGRPGFRIIVLRAGCSYRQRLESLLARRGAVGTRVMEFGTLETIIASVGAGLGVTLLPRALAETARRAGQVAIHALPPEDAVVETRFVRHRAAYVSSAMRAFVATVTEPDTRAEAAD